MGGHPWVYENDILAFPESEPENGTLADVVSTKGAYLGTGFVSLKSKIRVRLISRNANDTFDASFWRRRVEYAWAYRKTVLEPDDLSACRVIFGEADQFPGLTVDRFNNILVTQTLSVGMEKLKPLLFPLLAEVLRADGQTIDGIYERNDEASTTTSISRTARRPVSSSTRSTTAGPWHASPPDTPCWTASPTPAASPSTPPAAARPGSRLQTSAPTPSPWPSGTPHATA